VAVKADANWWMPVVEARDLQGVPGDAMGRARTRPPGNLAEHADRPSLQDADRAGEPVRADAASTDKVAGEKAVTRKVMSAAAHRAKTETTVSADDYGIDRAIDAELGVRDDAAIRAVGRPSSGLAETADGEPRWDSALAGEPVSAGAALVGKEPDNEAGTQIIMSAAADAVRGGTAVGADDSRIER